MGLPGTGRLSFQRSGGGRGTGYSRCRPSVFVDVVVVVVVVVGRVVDNNIHKEIDSKAETSRSKGANGRTRGVGGEMGREKATQNCNLCRSRRSTVEVHPNFSEDPHLRSSLPYPKNDLSKNQMASRSKSHGASTQKTFRRFWVKAPRHSETKKRKCATSIVERLVGRYGRLQVQE